MSRNIIQQKIINQNIVRENNISLFNYYRLNLTFLKQFNNTDKQYGYYCDNLIVISEKVCFIDFIKCNNTIHGNICKFTGKYCKFLNSKLEKRYAIGHQLYTFIIPHHCPLIHNRNPHKNFDLILSYEYYEKHETKQYTI